MIVFITGGAKNGKSSLAQKIALKLAGNGIHYYIATMIPVDDEDRRRISLHIEDRKNLGFETVEYGKEIETVLEKVDHSGTFLLDSITALYMNELFNDPSYQTVDMDASFRCINGLKKITGSVSNIILVSDYIYSDAVQYDSITEIYRKGLADIDRTMAGIADVVIEVTASNYIVHKGELVL